MTSSSILQEQYQQLRSYLDLYLTQEFAAGHRLITDADTHAFFAEEARQGKGKRAPITSSPPVYSTEMAPPPPAPAPLPTPKEIPLPKQDIPSAPKAEIKPSPVKAAAPLAKTTPSPTAPTLRVSKVFTLEPLSERPPEPLNELRDQIRRLFPTLAIVDTPLDDQEARQNKKETTPPVVLIIASEEAPAHFTFLATMAKGITDRLAPATLADVDALPPMEGIKLLLATRSAQAKLTTEPLSPLIPLEDLEGYLQNPALKRQLWNRICQHIPAKP